MDRTEKLLSSSTKASRIVEIGPSHAPIAPKAGGWNSYVIDHASQDELRTKYKVYNDSFPESPVNLASIEPVDFVWSSGALQDAVPVQHHRTFDTLIASHVIEHVPDFVAFFSAATALLKPAGIVSLAVPDKRFCFDFFKPASITGDVMEAHLKSASRHSRRTAFNYVAYTVTADGSVAWGQHPIGEIAFLHTLEEAQSALAVWTDDPAAEYRDYHAWQFTPASFELLILELGLVGVIDWHVQTIYPSAGCEFVVLLARGREGFANRTDSDRRRMTLLRKMLEEQREAIDYVLGPPAGSVGDTQPSTIPVAGGAATTTDTPEHTQQLQRIDANLTQIAAVMRAQGAQLRDIAQVASWQRRMLRPVRAMYFRVRGRTPPPA